MANTYTAVIPKILAQSISYLRSNSLMPRLVNRDYDGAAAEKGSTIDVPIPPSITTVAVTPSNTPPVTADVTLTTVQVPLSNHYEAPFQFGDKERAELMNGSESMSVRSAIASLCDYIDGTILTAMDVGGSIATGTAGTTPFASLSLALDPMQYLDTHKVMRADRRVVMNPKANANLMALTQFTSGDYIGDVTVMTDGQYTGNLRAGASWWMNQNCPTHTKGTENGNYLTNSASLTVGTTAIPADGGTGTIVVGDVVSFAGDTTNKYVVTSALSGGSFSIGSPGLKVAIADNAAITVSASHTANFAFSREAIVFASRPFQPSAAAIAWDQMTDPVSGLTVRVEVTREYKRDRWSIDALWGTKVVRPEGIIKVMG